MDKDFALGCLAQACIQLLQSNEGVVVSPVQAAGEFLYVWFDESEQQLKISSIDENESIFEDAGMTKRLTQDLYIGLKVWVHGEKPQ